MLLLAEGGSGPDLGKTRAGADHHTRTSLLTLAHVAAEGVGVQECRIFVPDTGGAFRLFRARRPEGGGPAEVTDEEGTPPSPAAMKALRTGRRLIIPDLAATHMLERSEAQTMRRDGDAAVIALPVATQWRSAAILELIDWTPRTFSGANVAFAEFMARQIARLLGSDDVDRGDRGPMPVVAMAPGDTGPSPRSGKPLTLTDRSLTRLADVVASSEHTPDLDAEALVLGALSTLRAHPALAACTLYRVEDGIAEPFPRGDSGGAPFAGGGAWRLSDHPPAARAVAGRTSVTLAGGPSDAPDPTERLLGSRGLTGVVLTPVVLRDRLVGVLEFGATSREGLAVATEVAPVAADLLAVTLGSGHVIARLQRRARDLALVVEAGLEDNARLSTDEILHAVAERLSTLTNTPVADLYTIEGDALRALVSYDGGRFDGEWTGVVLPLDRYHCCRRAVETGEVALVADLDDPTLDEEGRLSLEKWGYHSQLAMPLVSRGRVLGVVELSDYRPRDFSEDLDLIRGLGQVATHAIENASLFEEVDRRNRILNELVEIGSSASSMPDLDEFVRSVSERVLHALDAADCDIYRMVHGELCCVASYDRSGHDSSVIGSIFDRDRYPSTLEAVYNHQILTVTSPDDAQLSESERVTYRDYGFSSEVCLPLVVNDELQGLLDVYDTRERDFSEYLSFLRGTAQILGGVFENARLVEQLGRRTTVLRDVVELGAVASQAHDLEHVLNALAERLKDTLHAADCDIFALRGDSLRCLVSADRAGLDMTAVGQVFEVARFPGAAAAIRSGEPTVVTDLGDPRLSEEERRDMLDYGYQSELCIPLVSGDQVIGLIDVFDTRPRDYAEYTDFLDSVGHTAAGMIENALLLDRLERRSAALLDEVDRGREHVALVGDISLELTSSLDFEEVMSSTARRLCAISGAPSCDIYVLRDGGALESVTSIDGGETDTDWLGRRFPLDQWSAMKRAVETRSAIVVESRDDPILSAAELALMEEFGERSALLVPLISRERVIGVLELIHREPHRTWSADEKATIVSICRFAALAIDNAELYEGIKGMHLSNLKALSSALNAKDYYTLGHAARVAAYMVLLGQELGWPDDLIMDVEEAAYLHDIGKIGVSDRVLLKPSGLNSHEWGLMRWHPVFSAEIIQPLFDEALVAGVRHHHERWDGEGYPDGLAGQEIPPIARAMCVADSYDAMSFRRPYRHGLTDAECVEELERCSGVQFDPEMVAAFRRVLDRIAKGRRLAAGVAGRAAATLTAGECLALRESQDDARSEYASVTRTLRRVRGDGAPARYLTVFARRGRRTVVLAHSETGDDPGSPRPGDEVVGDDELTAAFAGRQLPANVLYVDQWGVWISGVAPVRDADGSVVAVVSADFPATEGVTQVEGLRSSVAQTFASMLHDAAAQSGRSELEAITDGLTGLYNHRYFHERLGEELERCRDGDLGLALLLCDLDNFRAFNDLHGHGSGDNVLRSVARVLEDSVRHVDLVARYGGEEFAAILIDTDEAGALEVAERIRDGITRLRFGADSISVSVGVATAPNDATFKDELVDKADWAMYLAKRRGRDKVMTFGADHGGETPEQAAVVHPDHVAVMSELVAAREAFRRRQRSSLAHIALGVAQICGVPAEEVRAALVAPDPHDAPGTTGAKIVALTAAYQELVMERPYRLRISEAEALDELLRCPAMRGEDELARAFAQVLAR